MYITLTTAVTCLVARPLSLVSHFPFLHLSTFKNRFLSLDRRRRKERNGRVNKPAQLPAQPHSHPATEMNDSSQDDKRPDHAGSVNTDG